MRIITDSAADFTREELAKYNVHCVQTSIIIGSETYTAENLSSEEFWNRMLAGENIKTSHEGGIDDYSPVQANRNTCVILSF